ncbi:MAG: hypothetical protein C0501_30755 [Isosphaera sp.]|nr:hypothetical protein [Isosphaera sp.]
MADPILSEILDGDALSLGAAARLLPAYRGAGTARQSTVWRWVNQGHRRGGRVVKLEAARLGGRWLTSKAAIARFMAALTSTDTAAGADATTAGRPRTPAARKKASDAASRRLAEMGA